MIRENPLEKRAYKLALVCTRLCTSIIQKNREYVLTKQCIKSSTSIGANIAEAQQTESRKDFISKFSIAIKEGYETRYWISLLRDTNNCSSSEASEILKELEEILAMLGASIRTAKKNLKTSVI